MNLCKVLETDADHLVQKVHSFNKNHKVIFDYLFKSSYMPV